MAYYMENVDKETLRKVIAFVYPEDGSWPPPHILYGVFTDDEELHDPMGGAVVGLS